MHTNIIDYFHKTNPLITHNNCPNGALPQEYMDRNCKTTSGVNKKRRQLQTKCGLKQLDQVDNNKYMKTQTSTQNDQDVIKLIQDSKFKQRLLNQIKYQNNLRPNLYMHQTQHYQNSQQENAKKIQKFQNQSMYDTKLKFFSEQQSYDQKTIIKKKQKKALEKKIIAEKTKIHIQKMKEISQVLQEQKQQFQFSMKQEEQDIIKQIAGDKKFRHRKYGRSISCDKTKKTYDTSVNDLQQKKIINAMINKNSIIKHTLQDIEENPALNNSYLNNDYSILSNNHDHNMKVVGLSKRMLENSFVNYSQKKQSEDKLEHYLQKYKHQMGRKAKKQAQYQPIYKLDPQVRPPLDIQLQRQQQFYQNRRKLLKSGHKRSFIQNSFELKGWKTDSTTQLQ